MTPSKELIFIFILSLCSSLLRGQIDSSFIKSFDQKYSVRVFGGAKYTSVNHDIPDKDNKVKYMTNSPGSLGLGFSWKNSSISGSYSLSQFRNKTQGKTKSIDFQYHYYQRSFLLDFYIQRHKGFYKTVDDKVEDIYPDLIYHQYGVSGQYVFNGNRFSYKAAFNQTEIQVKSSGSVLLGGGIYYNRINAGSIFADDEDYKQKNLQMGVSAGYAYTWVFKPRFYLTGSLTGGVHIGTDYISSFYDSKIEFYPTFFGRMAAGYNAEDWSLAFTFINNRVYFYNDNNKILSSDTGNLSLTYIKRFDWHPKSKLLKRIFGE